MYPYRSGSGAYGSGSAYGSGISNRSYQQQQPRAASAIDSQPFDDDLPMYVLREDIVQPRYPTQTDRLQGAYYDAAGVGRYEANPLRAATQRYYDEDLPSSYSDPGPKRLRTTYQEPYQEPRATRYPAHAATTTGYPQRPGEQKCSFYMRTAKCSYGPGCKFDHPAWVPPEGIPGWKEEEGEFPQRPGQPHCAYFMKNGTCKFGTTCKFDHPGAAKSTAARPSAAPLAERAVSRSEVFGTTAPLNSKGLPLRPTEPLCEFFKKTGGCKYGVLCKFDHPEAGSSKRKRGADLNDDLQDVPLYAVLPGSSFPGSSGPPPRPAALPQRPGQPECAFYMRTGSCQYGATCKYHHPAARKTGEAAKPKSTKAVPAAELTPAGLPRRPGATLCAYYMKTGLCKYAPDCKFDHPPPGEAAKMAYRAAAAEKAAPPVDKAAGGSSGAPAAAPKNAEQTPEKVEEAAAEGQGARATDVASEVAPTEEALGAEGNAGGEETNGAEKNGAEQAVKVDEGAQEILEEGGPALEGVSEGNGDLVQRDDVIGSEETPTEGLEAPAVASEEEPAPQKELETAELEGEAVGGEQVAAIEGEDADFVDAEGSIEEAAAEVGGAPQDAPEGDEVLHENGFDLNEAADKHEQEG